MFKKNKSEEEKHEEIDIEDDEEYNYNNSVTVFHGQPNCLEKTIISPGNGAKLKNVYGIIIHTKQKC